MDDCRCWFCGAKMIVRQRMGITYFDCTNNDCAALVSFRCDDQDKEPIRRYMDASYRQVKKASKDNENGQEDAGKSTYSQVSEEARDE